MSRGLSGSISRTHSGLSLTSSSLNEGTRGAKASGYAAAWRGAGMAETWGALVAR